MKIAEYLDGLASLHGKALNSSAGRIFLDALRDYPEHLVLAALDRCARELKTFPTIADVLTRIDDGHPGVEEAWAMVPKTEADSAVWTQEVQNAFYACASLLDTDPIGARMAFKETYAKELLKAKNEKRAPVWQATLGHDKAGRISVLRNAVEKGYLSADRARILLPDTAFTEPGAVKQLTNQNGPTPISALLPKPRNEKESKNGTSEIADQELSVDQRRGADTGPSEPDSR